MPHRSAPPDPAHRADAPVPDGADLATALADALRVEGVRVAPTSTLLCADALAAAGLADPRGVYLAGRMSLVHHPADFDAYDRAFDRVFGIRGSDPPPPATPPPLRVVLRHDAPGAEDRDLAPKAPESPQDLTLRFSATEVLRAADIAHLTPKELALAHGMISALRPLGPFRRGRRLRSARRRSGGVIDLRRTVERALRTGGEPLVLARRRPLPTPRRLVLLVDVSGSMEPYARAMLRFAHVLTAARRRVEVFALGTRLTRLTRALRTHDPDVALDAAAAAVPDWAGGTRLGQAFATFNDVWGIRGLARGAVVVILSDGWDRGDPAEVAEQMQRLQRVTRRIIWVNPLAADPGFTPVAAGMAAALPYIDDLRTGHSVGALEALVDALADAVERIP